LRQAEKKKMAKVLKDKLFGDSSKTFRPKKQQPRGTKRYDLHKQAPPPSPYFLADLLLILPPPLIPLRFRSFLIFKSII